MKWIAAATMFALAAAAWTQEPKHEISLWVAKDVAPSQKIRLNVNTKNITSVQFRAQPLSDPVAWFMDRSQKNAPPVRPFVAGQWTMSMLEKGQQPNPRQSEQYFSRQINLPPMKPGVYKLTATAAGVERWTVLNVTHLAVISKRSNYRTLVWVTDALNGSLIRSATVSAYQPPSHTPVVVGTTGADGATLMPTRPSEMLVVTRGSDHAFLRLPDPHADQPRIHFQTDRPIYRPGQTVQYKAIVRMGHGREYDTVANTPVDIEIRDPKDQVLDRTSLTTSAMGTVNGSFEIPSEAATGPYTIVVKRERQSAYSTFIVAEYRKPEYKAEVSPAHKRYLAGEELVFHVETSYFFGAPVQQAQVQYVVRHSSLPFWGFSDGDRMFYGGDGNLYPSDEYGASDVVGEDQVFTDAKGGADIRIKTKPDLPDQTYSISLTVTDGSRRQVTAGSSVPVYAAAVRIGLRSPMVYVPLGGLIPVEVVARDLDGKPVAAKVTLVLKDQVWNEKEGDWEPREIARTVVSVPASGKATANLPAKAPGDLTISATTKDSTGRTARSEMTMYVAGPRAKAMKENDAPELHLRLDRRTYKPGDTVKASVIGEPKGSFMLAVAEGEDIFAYAVLPAGSRIWEVKTATAMSPNAFITASQWVRGQLLSGTQVVPLPDPAREVHVAAVPDKPDYRPGETATYTIRTTDENGKPIPAEVALSVVDQAIYALRPDATEDLLQFYWGRRENRVSTQYSAPEEVSGGAFQRANPAAPVRQRFEDTAFWNPVINTGPDGAATISFEMPGNLTTWRATARAITLKTSVGTATSTALANRPVMMRLATPRQMVVGDDLWLISSINNRTEQSREFKALLEPTGITLDAEKNTQPVTVAGMAEGQADWHLRADKMPDTGSASLLGTTEPRNERNPDFSDALKVAFKIVPRGVVERSLGGGVLEQRGETSFTLPEDRIEPASTVRVRVWSGLEPAMQRAADNVLNSYRYGPMVAADQLLIASMLGMSANDKPVREAVAMLSRTQSYNGWGWWEGYPATPRVTAHVLNALARASKLVPPKMLEAARNAAIAQFGQDSLWDTRAQLASALVVAHAPKAKGYLDEVLRRGLKMSPFARLKLAEALALLDQEKTGRDMVDAVLKDALTGPTSAKIPAGEGTGWQATDDETTAQALLTLQALDIDSGLQSRIAAELATSSEAWRSVEDEAAVAVALRSYTNAHPDAGDLGDVKLTVNGTPLEAKKSTVSNTVTADVPREAIKSSNSIAVERGGRGQAFYEVQSVYYRPDLAVADHGLSVLRRIELKTPNGVWREIQPSESINAGDSIRSTVLVWGRGEPQPTRVTEPIPAGFEYVDEEGESGYSRQEVRDGAVVHYVMTSAEPLHFTYYLRSESAGNVIALPATAELLRSPDKRGQSAAQTLAIKSP